MLEPGFLQVTFPSIDAIGTIDAMAVMAAIVAILTAVFLYTCLNDEIVGILLALIPTIVVLAWTWMLARSIGGPLPALVGLYVVVILLMMLVKLAGRLAWA